MEEKRFVDKQKDCSYEYLPLRVNAETVWKLHTEEAVFFQSVEYLAFRPIAQLFDKQAAGMQPKTFIAIGIINTLDVRRTAFSLVNSHPRQYL